jgi:hypothetical protein
MTHDKWLQAYPVRWFIIPGHCSADAIAHAAAASSDGYG